MIDALKLLLNLELALALTTLYFDPFRSLHKRNWYTSCECGDQLWFPQTWGDVPPSHWQIWWVGFRSVSAQRSSNVFIMPLFGKWMVVVLSDIALSPQADLDTWVSPLTWSLMMTALTWKVLKNSWVLKSSPFPAVLIRVYMWPSTTVRVERRLNCEQERWVQCSVTLELYNVNVCLILTWFFFSTPSRSPILCPLSPPFFPSLLCLGNRLFFVSCLNYLSSVCLFPHFFFSSFSCLVPLQRNVMLWWPNNREGLMAY